MKTTNKEIKEKEERLLSFKKEVEKLHDITDVEEYARQLAHLFLGNWLSLQTILLMAIDFGQQHPAWVSVEEELPKINDVASSWDCSDDVYIYLATGSHCVGRYEHDKSTNEFYWVLYGVDKDIPVTHWMPIVRPRKEAKNETRS